MATINNFMSDKPQKDPASKTGPKPKKLVKAEYEGIEVGRGETKKVVDPKLIFKLASAGMKNSEISEWVGIDDSTLAYNFKQELTQGRLNLNLSLRQAQIQLALSGNATMLIWLGKQILGQTENPFNADDAKILPWTD